MTKKNEVKRYNVFWHNVNGDSFSNEFESYNGRWVKYSDYQALQNRLKEKDKLFHELSEVAQYREDKLNKAIEVMKVVSDRPLSMQESDLVSDFLKEVEE